MDRERLKNLTEKLAGTVFSKRTIRLVWIDLLRCSARLSRLGRRRPVPTFDKLHCGCGSRKIDNWLNVDLVGSDDNVDLLKPLPWNSAVFNVVVSQHVIEHLELVDEAVPLLHELSRVLAEGGQIWLSCPDLEKVCTSYVEHKMADMVNDRQRMWGDYSMQGVPPQHFANLMFHQHGYHKNLFDYPLLHWLLQETGFKEIERVCENDLLETYPEFFRRDDDYESVYVRAIKAKGAS